ncbi:MAG: DUF2974 domain-containing protein, partial [Eggerthellaceae bacterium]|nr:DUF2974 domain-containing protein [Eggerthellaceae bacterium]
HSKGGNLAVYAASTCSIEAFMHVAGVFDFDGPGFVASMYAPADSGRLELLAPKRVPEASSGGVVIESVTLDPVVKSTASGFEQHDLFSWIVRRGDFVYADKTSEFSRRISDTVDDWMSGLAMWQIKDFVETLFGMFDAIGAMKLSNLTAAEIAARDAFLGGLDPSRRSAFTEMVERLARSSVKSFDPIASVDEFIEKELLPQNLTPRERFDELADKFDALDDLYR